LTPYAADDFRYKLNPLDNEFSTQILADIINFQIWHYFNWSGRIIPNFLLQLFLVPSKYFFNFFNAIVQVLLINTIFYFANNRVATRYRDVSSLLLINLFLFFGFYKYSGLSIYLTSTISYTWTHLIVLIYYLPFWNFYLNGKYFSGKYSFVLLGIIAGCTNEHVFIAQLFFFLLIFILVKNSIIKVLPSFYYHSLIGVFTGGLILLFSPGNFVRSSTTNFSLSINSVLNYLIYDLVWIINDIKPFWFMVILLVIVYYYFYKKSLKISMPHFIILSVGIISSVSMALSPSYHSGTNLFLFICIIIFILSTINIPSFSNYLSHINIIITLFLFMYLYENHSVINNYFHETEKEILSEKEKGNEDLIIKNINVKTNRFVNYYAINNDHNDARNIHISTYYGIKSIKSVNQIN
jgi:Tfp pilus assembly protein PilE